MKNVFFLKKNRGKGKNNPVSVEPSRHHREESPCRTCTHQDRARIV